MSVDCGPPGAPQRGSLESYTNTTEGSEVFYSCNPGLVPEGRMRTVYQYQYKNEVHVLILASHILSTCGNYIYITVKNFRLL